jgi:hypothetical protein
VCVSRIFIYLFLITSMKRKPHRPLLGGVSETRQVSITLHLGMTNSERNKYGRRIDTSKFNFSH